MISREKIVASLQRQLKQLKDDIEDHLAELDVIDKVCATEINPSAKEFLESVIIDAFDDAEVTIKNGYEVLKAYKAIVKR
jgi:hypothetical protein